VPNEPRCTQRAQRNRAPTLRRRERGWHDGLKRPPAGPPYINPEVHENVEPPVAVELCGIRVR